jgi:hypothetical protein
MMAPLLWLTVYVIGVPIAMGLLDTYGFRFMDLEPNDNESFGPVLLVVFSFLWPAVLIMAVCFWLTDWAVWRED